VSCSAPECCILRPTYRPLAHDYGKREEPSHAQNSYGYLRDAHRIFGEGTSAMVATDITAAKVQAFIKDAPRDRNSDRPIRVIDAGGYRVGVFGVFRRKTLHPPRPCIKPTSPRTYYMLEGAESVTVVRAKTIDAAAIESRKLDGHRSDGIEGGVSRRLPRGDVVIHPRRRGRMGGRVSKETSPTDCPLRSRQETPTEVARTPLQPRSEGGPPREPHSDKATWLRPRSPLRRVRAKRAPQPEAKLFTPIGGKALTHVAACRFIKAGCRGKRSFPRSTSDSFEKKTSGWHLVTGLHGRRYAASNDFDCAVFEQIIGLQSARTVGILKGGPRSWGTARWRAQGNLISYTLVPLR